MGTSLWPGCPSLKYGNNRYETRLYNARLQASEVELGNAPNASDWLRLIYTYGRFNNGNVQTQQIIAPSVNRTQTYTYDGVNRLTAASESGGSWSQSFGYDQYGNRWLIGGAFPIPNLSTHFNTSTNRIASSFGSVLYDSAGNVTRQPNGLETMTYDILLRSLAGRSRRSRYSHPLST